MSGPCDMWDKCIQLISSDRALLDVLVRGARRRYECVRGILQSDTSRVMDDKEKAVCWSEAVREVVMAAFTDDGVVRLLKRQMLWCKEQHESAARKRLTATTERSVRGSGMATAPVFELDGDNKQATEYSGAENKEALETCGLMQPGHCLGCCSVGGQKAGPQERAGPDHTTVVGGDAVPRMIPTGSVNDSPPLMQRHMVSNNPLMRNTEGGEGSSINDLLVVKHDDQQSCFSSEANVSSRRGLPFSRSSYVTNAAAVDAGDVAGKKDVLTAYPGLPELCLVSPLLVHSCSTEHNLEAPADANVIAITGLLGEYHQQQATVCEASARIVEETAQTVEEPRELEANRVMEGGRYVYSTETTEGRGATNQQMAGSDKAALITTQGIADPPTVETGEEVEEAAETGKGERKVTLAPITAMTEYDKGDATGGKDGATETTEGLNAGICVVPERASDDYGNPSAQETNASVCDDIVRPKTNTSACEDPATTSDSVHRDDTEAGEEDYACDDFEQAISVGDPKKVHFSDEALWMVHEIRASFEIHELAELFYSNSELDRMLEEVEQEEKDEQLEAERVTSGGWGGSANEHGRVSVCKSADKSPAEGLNFDVLKDSSPEDDVYFESYSLRPAEDSDDDF